MPNVRYLVALLREMLLTYTRAMIDSRIVADFPECYAVNIVLVGISTKIRKLTFFELGQYSLKLLIVELFAFCKGGNFDIHIWALFGFFIC